VRRLDEKLRAQGAAGLVHGNRGRRPANRVADGVAERVVELARTTYAGFNPVHLTECLAADPEAPLDLSPRTSRGHPRGRRARRGRIGRERRARRGRGSTNGPAARGLEAWTGVDPGSDTPPLLLLRGL
jgi:hypothetical protein